MISPQGYSLGEEPKAKNPFWDGSGEDSNVNRIYATATVDENVGTPSVQTTKSIDGDDITFGFNFHNLKGRDGTNGDDGVSPTITVTDITGGHRVSITDASGIHAFDVMNGTDGKDGKDGRDGRDGRDGTNGTDGRDGTDGISPSVSVSDITGGHRITVTDATGSETFDVMNGSQGEAGETPEITITATQGGDTVPVTKTGSGASQSFEFAFPGGGGSASGVIGWGNYGTEIAGRYPKSEKKKYVLDSAITVNESGSNSVYITKNHMYNYKLAGVLPVDFVVGTKYTPEMTPSSGSGYETHVPTIMGNVSSYLTPTITPADEMTVDNVRVELKSLYDLPDEPNLQIEAVIIFDAHYNGDDMKDNLAYVNIQASAGEWSANNTYAYLEVFPEA